MKNKTITISYTERNETMFSELLKVISSEKDERENKKNELIKICSEFKLKLGEIINLINSDIGKNLWVPNTNNFYHRKGQHSAPINITGFSYEFRPTYRNTCNPEFEILLGVEYKETKIGLETIYEIVSDNPHLYLKHDLNKMIYNNEIIEYTKIDLESCVNDINTKMYDVYKEYFHNLTKNK